MRIARATIFAAALAAAGSAASAQEAAVRTATVAPGKVAGVGVVTALKKDCTIGEVGSIRIVTPPKNGSVELKGAKMKTPASFRCPNVDTPVQQIVYKPNAKYSGKDELVYETRFPDGSTQTVTVKINVTGKGGGKDLLDL